MKPFYLILLLFTLLVSYSCSTTKSSVEEKYISPDLNKEVVRTIAVSEIFGEYLFGDEKERALNKFIARIKDRYQNIAFSKTEEYFDSSNKDSYKNILSNFWNNYLKKDVIDEVGLFDLSEIVKTNAILQTEVIDVNKTFGEHRKTIAATKVKLRMALFSLKSGKLLWETTVYGTQENAHSDQLVPKTIEAVNVALTEVADELPF